MANLSSVTILQCILPNLPSWRCIELGMTQAQTGNVMLCSLLHQFWRPWTVGARWQQIQDRCWRSTESADEIMHISRYPLKGSWLHWSLMEENNNTWSMYSPLWQRKMMYRIEMNFIDTNDFLSIDIILVLFTEMKNESRVILNII